MLPFKIDVSELLDNVGSSFDVDGEYPLDELVVGAETFKLTAPVAVAVSVTNAGAGIVVRGRALAAALAVCSRCLVEFPIDIMGEIECLFLAPGEDATGDDDVERVDQLGVIDLSAVILAALVLEAPFVPLHDKKCAGLCPTCGCDLNEGPCACADAPDDAHPFAGLKSLLPDQSESPEDD
jgi:uncharacterized protein